MKIGLMVEGTIDEEILPPLIRQIIDEIPAHRGCALEYHKMPYPPQGAGEIPKNLRFLLELHREQGNRPPYECDLFLIILDSRKTEPVQKEIKKLRRGAPDSFPAIYGLAIQETEAWVLGDIENVNRHLFKLDPIPPLPRRPERDPDPKKTLEDLFVKPSVHIDSDCWNKDCALAVAPYLRAAQVAVNCPKGFGKLRQKMVWSGNKQ